MGTNQSPGNFIFTITLTLFMLWAAGGNPIESTDESILDEISTIHSIHNSDDSSSHVENVSQVLRCDPPVEYEPEDVTILSNNDLFLKTQNVTLSSSEYTVLEGKILTCVHPKMENLSVLNCSEKFFYEKDEFRILPDRSALVGKTLFPVQNYELNGDGLSVCAPEEDEYAEVTSQGNVVLNCSEKFDYGSHEYRILPNNSAVVGKNIFPEGKYELIGDNLALCVPEEPPECVTPECVPPGVGPSVTLFQISIYIGLVGSGISIIALTAHLLTFLLLPALRNLPGYNLASLSVAFLLAYSFVEIGQLPQVVGLPCVASAVLQHNFFLAAFFWMNVMAFDVWRSFKMATEELRMSSPKSGKRKFIWYSLYGWGVPLVITAISVIVDNADGAPSKIKPHYGSSDICWMNSYIAQAIFFVVPAFTLLLVNGIFFGMSSWTISSSKMKVSKEDQSNQNAKLDYVLYVKMAIMMGLTWLVGLIAIVSRNDVISLMFNLLNSLQGLFLFLLFTCTHTVRKKLSVVFASLRPSNIISDRSRVLFNKKGTAV